MKRTKEEAEKTRDNLINIALREFIKHGVENITLENIAAKAKVTRGAIYWHFNNKEDLLDSFIKIKDAESLEFTRSIFLSEDSAMNRIFRLINANFPELKTRKQELNYARLKIDLYNYYLKNGDNRKIGDTFVKYIKLLIIKAQRDGAIRKNVNAAETAYTIYSLIGGATLRFATNPGKDDTFKKQRKIFKTYFDQLKP
ncbi:MAG: TetR family transcriptional regulator [Bacteroidetes bacterium]|nr:TetR family transcriptional regulator [Bacteroidota bacterium]MBX7047063.1 TetR family transcriptional regulator [Ignavibacteria bacterium]